MKKLATLLISMATIVIFASVSVLAKTESKLRYTTTGTAGSYHNENAYAVSSKTLSTVCGGDVGAYFYSPKAGLQNSYVRDNNRKVTVNIYELDSGSKILARTRCGTFRSSNGIYAPSLWSYTYTNSARIESDSCPELYLSWKVNKVKGDTSTSIPAGIMYYSFWVY